MFGGSQPTGSFGGTGLGGGTTGGGFGSTAGAGGAGGGGAFGGSGTAFGGVPPCEGSANPPFSAYSEKDTGSSTMNNFQNLCAMQPYQKYSPEVRSTLTKFNCY